MKFALRLFRPLRPQASGLGPHDLETAGASSTSFAFSLFRPHAKSVVIDQKVLPPSPTMLAYMRGEPTCAATLNKTFGFTVFKREPPYKPSFVGPKRPAPSFAFSLFSPPRPEARGLRPASEASEGG